jgi:hypothetical protein
MLPALGRGSVAPKTIHRCHVSRTQEHYLRYNLPPKSNFALRLKRYVRRPQRSQAFMEETPFPQGRCAEQNGVFTNSISGKVSGTRLRFRDMLTGTTRKLLCGPGRPVEGLAGLF